MRLSTFSLHCSECGSLKSTLTEFSRIWAYNPIKGIATAAAARRRLRSLKTVQLEVRPVYHKTDDRIRSHVFLCTLAYYLQWHLKQRLEPLFAADGTHKDRQWTVRNVIERLAAIRRDKIAMGSVEFEKVTTPEPDQQTILDYLKVRL
jgi:hypothetical protein